MSLPKRFNDYVEACEHFNINLGLKLDEGEETQIKAYQLLGEFLDENNLSCEHTVDGYFEIKN